MNNDTFLKVVNTICEFNYKKDEQSSCVKLLSRDKLILIVEQLRRVLFPGYFCKLDSECTRFYVGATLAELMKVLGEQIKYYYANDKLNNSKKEIDHIITEFLSSIIKIRTLLEMDVQAAFEGDPSLHSVLEAVICSPGLMAITCYRIAHELFLLGIPVLPRIITEYAHSITGIDIHPGARIGKYFFIDHGTGVVIGETCIIGDYVRIYQGVTLGARSFPLDSSGKLVKGIERHPIVGDNVIIYSGATILGRVKIGNGSVIGGNVCVTYDLPVNSHITQLCHRRDLYQDGSGI